MRSIIIALLCLLYTILGLAQDYHNTWVNPILICDKAPFEWKVFGGVESFPLEEIDACIKPFESIAQVWLKVKVRNSGELGFDITPVNTTDDIDFIVFKSISGVPSIVIRCMATGLQMDKSRMVQSNCAGTTGLIQSDIDLVEEPGCTNKQNNFLKSISTEAGDEFLILITNYQSNNGFILSWSGDAIFDPTYCHSDAEYGTRLTISPNPASHWLNYNIITDQPKEGILSLFSQNGVVLQTFSVNLVKGSNEGRLALDAMPSGKYYLLLHQESRLLGYSPFEIVK